MVMKSEALATRTLAVLGIVSLVFLAGCGGGTASTANPTPTPNSTPTITTISPNGAVAGGAAFTLTINGDNFVAGSTVNFGGSAPATTFVDSTRSASGLGSCAASTPNRPPEPSC
jgi:IPT/TIG domain